MIFWGLFFFTLPVTSFPFFPSGIGGKTLVRPLAIYPLMIIFLIVILPRLFKRHLPATFLPLFAFTVAALISSIIAFSFELESLRGVTLSSRFIRNIATLGIGIAFYLTSVLLHNNWHQLKFSLRWIYAGFSLALLWGSLQAAYVAFYTPSYFKFINHLQTFISTRKLFPTRISGLTYEPKWFAEQICILLLPWLMSSILTGRSVFLWRRKWLTVEWLLLIWSIIILVFTFSRTGLAILGLLLVVGYIIIRSRRNHTEKPIRKGRKFWLFVELSLLVCGILAVFFVVGSQNPYFSRFWRYFTEARQRNRTYFEYIAFQQRFVYLETAINIFAAYPAFGVGLGNYAFFFDEMLPVRIYSQPEVIRQSTPTEERDSLITPKNLLARLLAETGLLGTITFLGFVVAVAGCAAALWFNKGTEEQFWGIGGVLALIVFSILIFTFDSFAIPNMWIVFGLITSAAHLIHLPFDEVKNPSFTPPG
ncbi:MAG: hypothetical protein A2Z16_05130 [Chloroflexi bacterium RBG_16_54_18]|nr:MAG: hypothetical protein A2Z16_05130 [Chloroflexi bacterium RBG_16_54_18]